jgi:hypothetical protein
MLNFHHNSDHNGRAIIRKKIASLAYRILRQDDRFAEIELYFGKANGTKGLREYMHELAWKRSELTGKFIGCPFWSVGAYHLFATCIARQGIDNVKDAERLIDILQSKKEYEDPDRTTKIDLLFNLRITHEHVFPRKSFVTKICKEWRNESEKKLLDRFDTYAVGFVVLESEHISLGEAILDNPWQRYADKIFLLPPPSWIKDEPWGQQHLQFARAAKVLVEP